MADGAALPRLRWPIARKHAGLAPGADRSSEPGGLGWACYCCWRRFLAQVHEVVAPQSAVFPDAPYASQRPFQRQLLPPPHALLPIPKSRQKQVLPPVL